MRIGFDVSPLTLARTGVGNYTYYLLRHLLREAEDCTIHALSTGLKGVELAGIQGLAGRRHIQAPTRLLYRLWSTFGRPRVDRLLGGVDVYHATNYFVPPAASARRVVTIHDLAFLREPALCSPKITSTFAQGVKHFAEAADAIVACSEATKRDIVELLGVPDTKVTVTYEAVDQGFAAVDPEAASAFLVSRYGLEAPFLLFVSTLEPRKNVEGLLKAFGLVRDKIPHTLVLVGGMGWNRGRIEREFEAVVSPARILRVGHVAAHMDLRYFYTAADAFVFPSFYEGFGLPVLEAMACGCPVITSNRASLPEVAGAAAELVDPKNTEELAASIRKVVDDKALRALMRTRGLAQARRFSWRTCARETLDVYRSLA